MKNYYYEQIDEAIKHYGKNNYSLDWICNKIGRCWECGLITENQKNELANRVCEIMENESEFENF